MDSLVIDGAATISLEAIAEQAERAKAVVSQVRGRMLAPNARKKAPSFTTAQLMVLTGLDKSQVDYRLRKGDLPGGTLNSTGSRREFTLAETRHWVREHRREELRPEGAEAITITVGNFKGGVTKTTTALTLAQGLSLRGHKVLVIDCDPQGSMTTLFGLLDTNADASLSRAEVTAAVTALVVVVPFQALGIPVDNASDCWGNKYTYVVTRDLTDSSLFLTPSTDGAIDIKTNIADATPFLTGAGYAIISHGEEGFLAGDRAEFADYSFCVIRKS